MSQNNSEFEVSHISGWVALPFVIIVPILVLFVTFFIAPLSLFLFVFLTKGFFILKPNEGIITTLFGKYNGSYAENGFFWMNPFASKQKISLKIHNYNSPKLKVNDRSGNPIEIGAVITFRVTDTYSAIFNVENYGTYIENQSEGVLRKITSLYPYDSDKEDSLKKNIEEISEVMQTALQKSFDAAGITVIDAKISHLAYAPEIAQVMLRRQQAEAVVAARQKIVEGAVLMVEEAIQQLENKKIAEFNNSDKVALVKNLMTVLVSENDTNQVITMN